MMRIESGSEPGRFNVRLTSSVGNLILVAATGFLRTQPVLRIVVGIVGAAIALAGTLLFLTGTVGMVVAGVLLQVRGSNAPIFLAFGAGVLLLAFLATNKFTLYIGNPKEVEEREKAEEEAGDSPDPYNSLELAQKRLNEYYAINQSQARGSFRWAVFAMFVGLSTIVAGVWIFYFGDTPNAFLTSLSTAAGVVVNTISGLYLYLHNRTQRRALFLLRGLKWGQVYC